MIPDTIFALSSGAPPAGIAVIRISGPKAAQTLCALTGMSLPKPRSAALRLLSDPRDHRVLDQALTVFFPAPNSATGEDVVELHLHGGRAVVAAALEALSNFEGLRPASAGEFTRRAFNNGKIDLATAEGLSDLLSAETEAQRKNAIAQVGGSLHRLVQSWVSDLLAVSAQVEALIDFSDEDDVGTFLLSDLLDSIKQIADDIDRKMERPPAERLYSGIRVAIVGPPNAGKSTLLNKLINRNAAIVSEQPGTTRDIIEAFVKLREMSLIFVDTAGIRETADLVEQQGIERTEQEFDTADIILALGGRFNADTIAHVIEVSAKYDVCPSDHGLPVSAHTGQGIEELIEAILAKAATVIPAETDVALNARHRFYLDKARGELRSALALTDDLLIAEHLRISRESLNQVVGGSDTEGMLDALFGNFCIGK